eukprot:6587774-Pyramimonas_sp.AAC.1
MATATYLSSSAAFIRDLVEPFAKASGDMLGPGHHEQPLFSPGIRTSTFLLIPWRVRLLVHTCSLLQGGEDAPESADRPSSRSSPPRPTQQVLNLNDTHTLTTDVVLQVCAV